jgi:hypothetical protein
MTTMGCFSIAGRPSRSATGAAAAGPAATTAGDAALPPVTNKPPFQEPWGDKHSNQSAKDKAEDFKRDGAILLTGRHREASEGGSGRCRRRTHPGGSGGRGMGGGEVGTGHIGRTEDEAAG